MSRHPRVQLPDPGDPANLGWWQVYDLLFTIAHHAACIATAAQAAQTRMANSEDPDLEVLATQLDCWCWNRESFDIISRGVLR